MVITPKRKVNASKSKARGNSTTQVSPSKQRLAKINIDACLTNSLRVKMPYGLSGSMPLLPNAATSTRHSDLS